MRFSPAAAALTLVVTGAMAQDLKTEDQKTLYALGTAVAKDLKPFGLTPQEAELVLKGLGDALAGRTLAVDAEAYRPKVQAFAAARRKVAADQMAVAGKAYLAKAATEKGAVKLESGLVYIPLKEGTGPHPLGHGHGQGPLPRHLDRRHGVRQLLQAGPARPVRAEQGPDQGPGRGAPEDEGRRKGQAGLPPPPWAMANAAWAR